MMRRLLLATTLLLTTTLTAPPASPVSVVPLQAQSAPCRAIIGGVAHSFGGPLLIRDTLTNGWAATFDVIFLNCSVDRPFDVSQFEAEFSDSDSALTMDNKVRNAARAHGAEFGYAVPLGGVISFAPPRRL